MRWVFGYGSIIWRPSFSYLEARPAFVRGWRRRFWQGSPDHRGTPSSPGRVVTLVADPDAICHGMAFAVGVSATPEIFASLDVRESGGYVRMDVDIEFPDQTSTAATTYYAPPENRNFLGPASLDEIAAQVSTCVGASGENSEYVLRLAEALRELEIIDEDVAALEMSLRAAHRRCPHGLDDAVSAKPDRS